MKENKPQNDKIQFSIPLNRRTLKYSIVFLIMAMVVYSVVVTPDKVGAFIGSIISLFSPLIIGVCLAYVVNLLLRPIERLWLFIWKKQNENKIVKALKRPICLILSYALVVGVIFTVMFLVVPSFKSAIISFAEKVPQYVGKIEGLYHNVVGFFVRYNFELPQTLNTSKITEIATNVIAKYGSDVIGTTINVTSSIITAVVNMFLGLVFSIYILCQKETLSRQANKAVKALFKPHNADRIVRLAALTNTAFTRFVTGQLAEVCIIGVLCFSGMLIFDIPYAAIVSLMVAFTALIPILGAFIGTGLGAVLILLEDPMKAFWFIIFIIIIQQIDNNIIYPRVVGKSVGLPGLWVLTAVTVGGSAFGFMGMLFSVPICSVLYALFRDYVNRKNDALADKETAEDDDIVETE